MEFRLEYYLDRIPAGPPSPAIRCAWAIGWPGGRGGGKGDLGELRFLLLLLLSLYHYFFLWDQLLLLLDIFLPVKVGEFTIWGAVRGGVWMTVGHPGLVEPAYMEIRFEHTHFFGSMKQ